MASSGSVVAYTLSTVASAFRMSGRRARGAQTQVESLIMLNKKLALAAVVSFVFAASSTAFAGDPR
ncbi:MAG: hypothetical protein ACJAYU_005072 [Bradymonadia bacterium]|jgi:hypothetical protein